MYCNIAIKIENIFKRYEIYNNPADRLKQFVFPKVQSALRLPCSNYYNEFWALRDVSFDVYVGETVGIIGRNGSGKSTLLQIICGTLSPTSGNIETNGLISALLELGSGFNPEFTGLENIYLNGSVLGLSEEEVDRKLDQILSFADIGDFVNRPVKTYSSGMMVRLAFSVAINVDPKILIVDEALTVGDELFQRKCFSKIEELKRNGTTILFVSHSGAQILELCDRAVFLDSGQVLMTGLPKEVMGTYQRYLYSSCESRVEMRAALLSGNYDEFVTNFEGSLAALAANDKFDRGEAYDPSFISSSKIEYESNGATLLEAWIENARGNRVNSLICGNEYFYKYLVSFSNNIAGVRFAMLIKTLSGVELGGYLAGESACNESVVYKNGDIYQVSFKFSCILNPGVYFLNAGVRAFVDGEECYLHRVLDVYTFKVQTPRNVESTAAVDFDFKLNVLQLPNGCT